MADNQIATFKVSGQRLAKYLGISFGTPIWWNLGIEDGLSEKRIQALVEQKKGLAPEPGKMGNELVSVADHEARIAWLVNSQEGSWDPLPLTVGCEGERVVAEVNDGHHRLMSSLIMDRQIHVDVVFGEKLAAETMVAALEGEWLMRPEQQLFGQGIFLATALGNERFVEISCEPGKIWVNDTLNGMSVARYGKQLWTIEPDPMGDVESRLHEVNSVGSQEEHLRRFFDACEVSLGVDKASLARYCRGTMA